MLDTVLQDGLFLFFCVYGYKIIKENVMIYNLKNYRYKNFKLYKRIWGFLYKCIDKGPYGYMVGVRKINELCGIDEKVDCSQLTLLPINNEISGKFLVNFKKIVTGF